MELLVIENPTSEGKYPTREEVDDASHSRPIGYIANDADLGLYGSINRAVGVSNGRWIHILHDDDWVLPGFYERIEADLKSLCGTFPGVVFTHYTNVDEDKPGFWSPPLFKPGEQGPEFLARILSGNPLQMCAVAFSRDHFEEVGPFNESLPYCADWEWYIRSFLKAEWWHHARSLARYRVHATNLSRSDIASGLAAANIQTVHQSIPGMLMEAIRQ